MLHYMIRLNLKQLITQKKTKTKTNTTFSWGCWVCSSLSGCIKDLDSDSESDMFYYIFKNAVKSLIVLFFDFIYIEKE